MSMDRLPTEILLMIFRHIDDFRQMFRLELVCRRWHQIMLKHGWKHVRQVANGRNPSGHITLTPGQWVRPIGGRCGNNLVDCSFYSVAIDSNLMRLIAENLPTLRHLKFRSCQLRELEADALDLDTFTEFGARLRSLTLFHTEYHPHLSHNLLRHFPRLRHLGVNVSTRYNYANDISRNCSAQLRSLYIQCLGSHSFHLEQMLANVQKVSPGLTALFLDVYVTETILFRISELKRLRFLHIGRFDNPDSLSSCLANLSDLRALQIFILTHQLPDVLRSLPLHGLVHLSLCLFAASSVNFEFIGLLSTVAPQLRSLNLHSYSRLWHLHQEIGGQVLKIARNAASMEHLNVPCASFTIADIKQIVRLCPNLQTLYASTSSPWKPQSSEVAELHRAVADQWREGSRKHLPLRIWLWINENGTRVYLCSAIWKDPFLVVRHVDSAFVPINPVLDKLFREEVFNGEDDGGTPSFVSEYYSNDYVQGPLLPANDLVMY